MFPCQENNKLAIWVYYTLIKNKRFHNFHLFNEYMSYVSHILYKISVSMPTKLKYVYIPNTSYLHGFWRLRKLIFQNHKPYDTFDVCPLVLLFSSTITTKIVINYLNIYLPILFYTFFLFICAIYSWVPLITNFGYISVIQLTLTFF